MQHAPMATIPAVPDAATPAPVALVGIAPGLPPANRFWLFFRRYRLTHKKTIMVNMT